MSLFDLLFRRPSAESIAQQQANQKLQAEIKRALHSTHVPEQIKDRLEGARSGALPWMATLTPAELLITRSHGIRPIAAVSATCWLHYGYSWTNGHTEGWNKALTRLKREAHAAGANAVLDVKMRTIRLGVRDSMDFSLIGTAVRVEGLPPSKEPIVATVPALEFVKLLEADVVPTGIAIGAHYEWLTSYGAASYSNGWLNSWTNAEVTQLSKFWERVRRQAHAQLRRNAEGLGNGVLAHLNFSQMFASEGRNSGAQYLGRHIVVATVVDAQAGKGLPHDIKAVVDMHDGGTPLSGRRRHHSAYRSRSEREGAI